MKSDDKRKLRRERMRASLLPYGKYVRNGAKPAVGPIEFIMDRMNDTETFCLFLGLFAVNRNTKVVHLAVSMSDKCNARTSDFDGILSPKGFLELMDVPRYSTFVANTVDFVYDMLDLYSGIRFCDSCNSNGLCDTLFEELKEVVLANASRSNRNSGSKSPKIIDDARV